ncbi:TPA: helix-turn-helix domain-containing protein [Streptococcus suis]|nr:helix-turn-helix domain-containing protein [Streptococcus suis]HEM5936374.1 helix-turn-helix domain-containing protein [Streptococcus suis]HEM5940360.1 helix-turn-helix domain-containing protein [Streptococcus suis]HEM5946829.1 helix-turn-helix domain-containing protein [Streptococcus suis]HEM5951012.1 helix-turn-helix domain-containing protein [Streptococcus suis]
MGRRWTAEEIAYLEKKCDRIPLKNIAKRLKRSTFSVRSKMQRLDLTIQSTEDFVSLMEFCEWVDVTPSKVRYWIRAKDFPARKRGKDMKFQIEDFWKWAEQNKKYIDWDRFPRYVFLPEPAWLDEQKSLKERYRKWTAAEDKRLAVCLANRYSYNELVAEFGRSKGAIRRRIYDLYLPKPRRENVSER